MMQINTNKQQRFKGILMAFIAASLWGIQGNFVDHLFRTTEMTLDWIIIVRLFYSGIILLLLLIITKQSHSIFLIWKNKQDSFQLVLFSVLGLLGLQYSFFASIQYSNAATAAILQYLAPSLLVIYACFKLRKAPEKKEVFALIFTILGLYLLVTNGDFNQISISGNALFWGIASAFALAVQSRQPINIIQKYGSILITMWAMFIGSIVLVLKGASLIPKFPLTFNQWLIVLFIIATTVISFYLYLTSLNYITSSEASLLTIAEPLTAVFITVTIMGIAIGNVSLFGGFIIIVVIVLMERAAMLKEKMP